MVDRPDFDTVADRIRDEFDGRIIVTVKDNFINLSVHDFDLTGVESSVPENGGPLPTIDNPQEAIPDTILRIAEDAGYEATLFGHGETLHIHVK